MKQWNDLDKTTRFWLLNITTNVILMLLFLWGAGSAVMFSTAFTIGVIFAVIATVLTQSLEIHYGMNNKKGK